jgi:hypothetical protein
MSMYTPPVPPSSGHRAKKSPAKLLGIGCIVLLGLVIGALVIGMILDGNSKTLDSASRRATVNSSSPPPAQHKTSARVVLTEYGKGTKSTATFSVLGDWDLSYSFNCAVFGSEGDFIVDGTNGGSYVIALAMQGKGTTHLHDGNGAMRLSINSECSWKIQVEQL